MSGVQETFAGAPRPHRARRLLGAAALRLYRWMKRGRDKTFSVAWAGAFAGFGRNSVIQLPVRIRGERRIVVGSGVFIGAGSWLQIEGDVEGDVALVIGDGSSIVGDCTISASSLVSVGRRVLIARNVYIADHMHAFDHPDRPVLEQGIEREAAVEIGDGSWLGQNVVIGPGVRVGRGAIVGANSVVLSDVPDRAVAVGAPARVVRLLDEEAARPAAS